MFWALTHMPPSLCKNVKQDWHMNTEFALHLLQKRMQLLLNLLFMPQSVIYPVSSSLNLKEHGRQPISK